MVKKNVRWEKKPDQKDYDAALNYLSLIYTTAHAGKMVKSLRKSKMTERAAKDLLRASGLPLLSRDEPHVSDDLTKIRKGKSLSPVLLIQGDLTKQMPLVVADGYHRICAICYYDENAPIPCCMASL
jgi:hypothetical protein